MAEFLNKFMADNHLDGLVPTLELEDLYPEDGPLLKDHFLGVVDGLSGDQPLCVVFVDPNTNTNGDHLYNHNYGNNSTQSFYDEFTAPSWLEHNVDLNNLDSVSTNTTNFSPPDSVSTAPFVESNSTINSQNFIPDTIYETTSYSPKNTFPFEANNGQKIRPTITKSAIERSELEYSDYYYDASSESMVSSVHSTHSWESTEEEYPSKEAILEEIHREAAQIERFSVSPPGSKPSARKTKPISKNSKSRPASSSRPTKTPKTFVERKKELNRAAATKYREKKRAEREYLHGERETLETRNTELKAEISAMTSEIDYLKKLIKDIEARTKH